MASSVICHEMFVGVRPPICRLHGLSSSGANVMDTLADASAAGAAPAAAAFPLVLASGSPSAEGVNQPSLLLSPHSDGFFFLPLPFPRPAAPLLLPPRAICGLMVNVRPLCTTFCIVSSARLASAADANVTNANPLCCLVMRSRRILIPSTGPTAHSKNTFKSDSVAPKSRFPTKIFFSFALEVAMSTARMGLRLEYGELIVLPASFLLDAKLIFF